MQGEKSILFLSCKSCKYREYIVRESGLRNKGALAKLGTRGHTQGWPRTAGEPSVHSAGKQRSAGKRTGESAERGNAGECRQVQEGAGEHRKLQKSGFHRPGREQAYQHTADLRVA